MSKIIAVNPEYLSLGKKKKKPKKKIDKKMTRRNMLKKIMELRKERSSIEESVEKENEEEKSNDFDDSLSDLNQFVKEYQKKLTLKKKNRMIPVYNDSMDGPDRPDRPDRTEGPNYSCLKNGSKPTYKQINRTMRNRIQFPENVIQSTTSISDIDDNMNTKYNSSSIQINEPPPPIIKIDDNSCSLSLSSPSQSPSPLPSSSVIKIDDDSPSPSHSSSPPLISPPPPRKVFKRKRFRKSCKLGKRNNKIKVLLPNRYTRRKESTELETLSKLPLSKVKQYLRSKMLIQVGCTAPEYILREMMRNAILSGDLQNKNKETILKNLHERI